MTGVGYAGFSIGHDFENSRIQMVIEARNIAAELLDIVPEPQIWTELSNEIFENFIKNQNPAG